MKRLRRMMHQVRVAQQKASPEASPKVSPGSEAKEVVAKARREAEAIVNQARAAGAAQAASLLEVGPSFYVRLSCPRAFRY